MRYIDGTEDHITVTQWPLKPWRIVQIVQGKSPALEGATDVLLHFDRIRVGGAHNCRRVRVDDLGFYIEVADRKGKGTQRWRIVGALAIAVFDAASVMYRRDEDFYDAVQISVDDV